jgi:uncharacterized protein (TIGR02996 family)
MLRAEESSYIDNILAEPRKSGPRLAYADWQKAQGNQQCEEYLGLQCRQKHFLGQNEDFWESRQGWGKARGQESGPACDSERGTSERLRELEKGLDPGWLVWVLEDFALPPGLSARGKQAAKIILGVIAEQKAAETGGISLFRSPDWGRQGGLIKQASRVVLIVVYDVWLQTFFEYVPHRSHEQSHEAAMEKALRAEHFFAESDGFGRAFIIDNAAEQSKPAD